MTIVRMLNGVRNDAFPFTQTFLCSSLTAHWYFERSVEGMRIRLVWSVVNGEVNGEPVDLTTFNVSAGELVTSPEEFIFEW